MSGPWWIVLIIFFAGGGFARIGAMGRNALRTRHERKMERIAAEERHRAAIEAENKPPEPVCGCTHHLAKHDKQGKCHEIVEVPTAWDSEKKPVQFAQGRCNCQQYVGPQPLGTVYAEPLTDVG